MDIFSKIANIKSCDNLTVLSLLHADKETDMRKLMLGVLASFIANTKVK
jgi:hypothetical protein